MIDVSSPSSPAMSQRSGSPSTAQSHPHTLWEGAMSALTGTNVLLRATSAACSREVVEMRRRRQCSLEWEFLAAVLDRNFTTKMSPFYNGINIDLNKGAERILSDFGNVCGKNGLRLNFAKTMLMSGELVLHVPLTLNVNITKEFFSELLGATHFVVTLFQTSTARFHNGGDVDHDGSGDGFEEDEIRGIYRQSYLFILFYMTRLHVYRADPSTSDIRFVSSHPLSTKIFQLLRVTSVAA
ncbi:unnamed protein product [Angiostrongylus costaricensis]|uniref:Uncharacterized protein n=1 Tax=Angiostrongylus costaricensis TaxID=334426 RepID=A0A0R3PZ71_ANGCS|nr:unnamed protein product [Angiostrongylus costaricensis]